MQRNRSRLLRLESALGDVCKAGTCTKCCLSRLSGEAHGRCDGHPTSLVQLLTQCPTGMGERHGEE
jgi:hypothetical protein